jgi:hypothetical protein
MNEPQNVGPGSKVKHGERTAELIMWSVIAANGITLAVAIDVGNHLLTSSVAQYGFVILAVTTMTVLGISVGMFAVYFTSKSADAGERRRLLLVAVALDVAVLLGITCMVLLVSSGGAG